jgi:hypothetical protein
MKIKKLKLSNLRNHEHFQFHTEFMNLAGKAGADKLKIEELLAAWLLLYRQEDEALQKILKSDYTTELSEADDERDRVFRGLADANRAALNHFNPKVHKAARQMQIVFDTYGNVAPLPVAEETSAVGNLLKELTENQEANLQETGLTPWVEELYRLNKAVEDLTASRNAEVSGRTDLVLRPVRRQVDEAFRAIAEKLDARTILDPDEILAGFVHELNTIIDRYHLHLAQRKGPSEAKKEEEAAATGGEL